MNGLSSFCDKDSINLSNNPGLPYGEDITYLCENGWGTDSNIDGPCNEKEDCNDYDFDINPNADEVLCDAIDKTVTVRLMKVLTLDPTYGLVQIHLGYLTIN